LYFLLPQRPFSPLKHRNDVILSEDNTEAYVWLAIDERKHGISALFKMGPGSFPDSCFIS
ncbi:MAG: hypothetical protein IIY11_02635, partial [Clostridia bacterium]|nr:hypothetical protein [Clostridia bacterium]